MSKGIQTFKDAKKHTVSVRTKGSSKETGDGGQGGSRMTPRVCWDFPLVQITGEGRLAKRGTNVNGPVRAGRVVVMSPQGALGFAPPRESAEMVAAASATGRALTGKVTANHKNGSVTRVELCL